MDSEGAPAGDVVIRVTAVDLDTRETSEAVISDDYVLICAGSCYRAAVEVDLAGRTHVITVRGVKRKARG